VANASETFEPKAIHNAAEISILTVAEKVAKKNPHQNVLRQIS